MNQHKSTDFSKQCQSGQIALEERIESLKMQIEALSSPKEDLDNLEDLLSIQNLSKNIRGNQLLKHQCKLATKTERQTELARYQKRIQQLSYTLARKEEEIWQHSWNGKRIRYLGLHPEHMLQFNQQLKQTSVLVEQLAVKSALQKEVASLQRALKTVKPKENILDFKRIETAFIKQLLDEGQKEQELTRVYLQLQKEEAQLSSLQQNFIKKYTGFAESGPKTPRKDHEEPLNREGSSSKSISTSSDGDSN